MMAEELVFLTACCECNLVYNPEKFSGLTTDFIDATIKANHADKTIDDYFVISHGYCRKHYEKAMEEK